MLSLLLQFVIIAYFILYALAISIPLRNGASQSPLLNSVHAENTNLGPQSSLDAWIDQQERISLQKLLDNIAPGGKYAADAAPGTVLASPSREHPDYYYQWIRDAGITTGTLVSLYEDDPSSALSSRLISILEAYANLSSTIQRRPNPSGTFVDLSGLGEPKFEVDGTPFTANWGRPQRDGPALRAITLMRYIRAYNSTHPELWDVDQDRNPFEDLYQPELPADSIIKADLEYVAKFWQSKGFDLWEEVNGMHFFTAMVQLRALREGSSLATAFKDQGASRWYHDQADRLEEFLHQFWDSGKGHIIETLDSSRSGLDCGILLGAIHGTSEDALDDSPFPPHSDEILMTLLALVLDQRFRFPINAAPIIPANPAGYSEVDDQLAGVGVGRYPEDVYDGYGFAPGGGNPWFLCTSSVSEILYRTSKHLSSTKYLNVTSVGLPFWKALLPTDSIEANHVYKSDEKPFQHAVERLQSVGDAFLSVVRTHTDAEGALSEQFDRVTGFERGARDLTWSYGAFLQAVRVRKEIKN